MLVLLPRVTGIAIVFHKVRDPSLDLRGHVPPGEVDFLQFVPVQPNLLGLVHLVPAVQDLDGLVLDPFVRVYVAVGLLSKLLLEHLETRQYGG